MASTCPSCGEESVIWEEYSQQITDGKPQQVCTECGLVLEEGSFFIAEGAEGTSDVKVDRHLYESSLPTSYLRRNKTETESKTKKTCEKLIVNLGSMFDLPDDVIERSKELFGIIYKAACFQGIAVETKKITAGCCLFAVCRMSDIPMLIKFFTDALNCRKEKFSLELKRLVHITDIKIPPQDISDYVSGYCRNLGMSDAVKSTTLDIIEVAKNTWISQGRQTDHVLAAAVYIAWVAEEPTTRLKTKLQTFFKKNSAHCANIKVTRQRYTELVQVICKLAKEIPWVDVKEANLKTAVFNLKDVVNYQQSLLHEASARVCSDDHLEPETKTICAKQDNATTSTVTSTQDDVTIVARDLTTNTTTTTELSLVATVTEHTDFGNLDLSNCREKEQCDTASEGSSEGGHHYSIIVSPGKNKGDTVQMEVGESSCSTPAQSSPQRQVQSKAVSNSAENQILKPECQSKEESDTTETKVPSGGYKRQKSIVEGTLCVDQEGYDTLKALGTRSVKSLVNNNESSDSKSENTCDTDESITESSQNAGEIRLIGGNTSSQYSEQLHSLKYGNDSEVRKKVKGSGFSEQSCDKITNQQKSADEFRNISDSKYSDTKRRKRTLEIQKGEILPSCFLRGRQISQEKKRLKREDDVAMDDNLLAEVTIQEIDEDIEQYFRTDEEVDLIKKLQAKK